VTGTSSAVVPHQAQLTGRSVPLMPASNSALPSP
jgi:hypothetical protein